MQQQDDKPLIEWSKKYSVEVQKIDEQHKKLIEMINDLFAAFKKGKARLILREILDKMMKYADYHFKTEEELLKQCNYAEREEHIKQHEAFSKKVNTFYNDYKNGKISVTYDVINFLRDWILHHIKGSDKKYMECMKEAGIS